jgi:serine protease Do
MSTPALGKFGRRYHALILSLLLGSLPNYGAAQETLRKDPGRENDLTLVKVNITTETLGPGEPVEINGKRISGYRPKIIHIFPSTGVVMDENGHVLTFLGYRWVDLHGTNPRVDIITYKGEQFKGKMVGIDQATGVAVVRSLEGMPARTLVCRGCEIRGGDTVVAPVWEGAGESQFQSAQILSVGEGNGTSSSGFWMITMNRPLPGIGEPLLDREHRVLGLVASQQPSREDPMGMRTAAYTIDELLASAEKILRAGGNINDGWLGIYPDDSPRPSVAGIRVKEVVSGSPAQKAGLRQLDLIVKWNGKEVSDVRQFIRMVQGSPVGSKVSMDILRNGKPISLQALIQTRMVSESPGRFVFSFPDLVRMTDAGAGMEMAPGLQETSWAGIETAPLTQQLADFLQVPWQAGVIVLNVDSSMPFSRAGVQAGDIILAVNGQQVDSPQTFFSHLRLHSRNAEQVILKMLRKGAGHVTTMQLSLSPFRNTTK